MITTTPFNGDPALEQLFERYIHRYKPDIIIETGTFQGHTTKFLAKFGIPVTSIEISDKNYNDSKNYLKDLSNVRLLHMASIDGLKSILEEIRNKRVFAFLDAHWQNDNALANELLFFAENNMTPFIAIHDFKVPGIPELGYDRWNNMDYSFENYSDYFDRIYGVDGYNYWYNTATTGQIPRGVIFLEQK